MFVHNMLASLSWGSFFALIWLLLLGEIGTSIVTIAVLVLFGLLGSASTGRCDQVSGRAHARRKS